jgi:hypothetical protein
MASIMIPIQVNSNKKTTAIVVGMVSSDFPYRIDVKLTVIPAHARK